MTQLPSAQKNRSQHFANLNQTEVPKMGTFWMIDEDIYDEFLNMLPPVYCTGGFRMSEDRRVHFLWIGDQCWCGYAPDPITLMKQIGLTP